jgi:hypothetical protein
MDAMTSHARDRYFGVVDHEEAPTVRIPSELDRTTSTTSSN